MVARDTSIEAAEVQLSVFRRMTPSRRVELALEMSERAFATTAAGIRSRHGDYTDDDVEWALKRVRVGDPLFGAAWPDAPLLDP